MRLSYPTITPEEYEVKVSSAFPDEVLKALMLGVTDAYRAASEHCKRHFDREDRHDLIGRARRAKVHESVRGVAERFKLAHDDVPHANSTTRCLCVIAGEIRLVCCLVPSRRSIVRPAKLRKVWARDNYDAQCSIFSEGPDLIPSPLQHLAVLAHAPRPRQKEEVGFVDVVIPDRHFRQYNCKIELFEKFPQEAEAYRALFRRRRGRSERTGAGA